MADKVKRVDYFNVRVPNQPGQAFQLLSRLKEANVNLLSFTVFPSDGTSSQVVLVPEKAETFVKAAERAGILLSPKKVAFFAQGKDRAGALAEVFQKLADAKINVHAANAASAGSTYGFIFWVKAHDVDAAARALGI